MKLKAYLQLARPANIVTSVSDILAGIAIATIGLTEFSTLPREGILLLILSTVGLYGGGIVFNDVADADLDAIERPERPIPSGKVTSKSAFVFAIILLAIGIIAAFLYHFYSGILSVLIALLAIVYDIYGKHHKILGPVNMGMCRGFNLLLGISIIPTAIISWYWVAVLPIIYIAAVTMISRGEVHGSSKTPLIWAAILYTIVHLSQGVIANSYDNIWISLPFILLHILLIFRPLFRAIKNPSGSNIGKSVKAGVLSLIIMNAAWASVSGNIALAIITALLLPLSVYLGNKFAVT